MDTYGYRIIVGKSAAEHRCWVSRLMINPVISPHLPSIVHFLERLIVNYTLMETSPGGPHAGFDRAVTCVHNTLTYRDPAHPGVVVFFPSTFPVSLKT